MTDIDGTGADPVDLEMVPLARTLGVELMRTTDGSPQLIVDPSEKLVGRPGFLHGGAIASLLEIIAMAALQHRLAGETPSRATDRTKQINITVDYLRGVKMAPCHGVGEILRFGRSTAVVDAHLWQEDRSRPCATARLHYKLSPADS